MKQLTHEINLNMTQPNNFEYVYAMQSDYDSEIVVATLYDGNTLYTIDANQAVLNGVTENGNTIVYNNVTIDSDKHRISFPLTKEMLFESGDTRFVVSFFDTRNNQRKSAFPFIIKSVSDAEGTLPVSVLKKISEYVAEAAASAQEAKESAKNAKDSEDNAKKYATEAKSYAVGDTGIREGENTDNSKYYYETIKTLIKNSGITTGEKPANIKYYPTYGEFKTDFADGKIDKETLILIGEDVDHLYSVQIIPGDNMTWDASSGNLKQNSIIEKLNEVVLKANNDYYFPTSYFITSSNGIMVTRDSFTQISVSGKPTANTKITLLSPTEKGNQAAPTGLSNGYTQINGTTTNMEYADSASSSRWIACTNGSTSVATKTWYVRYKETDTLKASPATQVIVALEPAPSSITDLKITGSTTDSVTLSFSKPSGAVKVELYCSTSSSVNNTNYEKQTSITNSTTTYTFTGLTSGKTYYFCAYAVNSSDALSAKSNVVSAALSGSSSGGGSSSGSSDSKKIYLYNEGDECTSITGGWQFIANLGENQITDDDAQKLSNCMSLTSMPHSDGTHLVYITAVTKNNISTIAKMYDTIGIEYSYNNYNKTTEAIRLYLFANATNHHNGGSSLTTLCDKQAINVTNKCEEKSYKLSNSSNGGYFGIEWEIQELSNSTTQYSTLKIHKIYLIKKSS